MNTSTKDRLVKTIDFSNDSTLYDDIQTYALNDRRSFAQMARVLLEEAVIRRQNG